MIRVHQVCARLQFGDAITNHVLRIHRELARWGLESHIYAHDNDSFCARFNEGEAAYRRHMRKKDEILLYHYSVFNPNHKLYEHSRNKRVFIYHNITPPEFFEGYNPGIAEVCRQGRELLPKLTGCDLALGDSEFNRLELVAAGFDEAKTGVLPIFVDWQRYSQPHNARLERRLRDGRSNILFVGRLVPNKRLDDLIRLFALYRRDVNARARLIIPGSTWSAEYNSLIYSLIRRFRLQDAVEMPGRIWGVPDADLLAYFKAADLFVSMSEHEGFSVPLVESMYFGLPVLAYDCTAMPYTLAGSGVLFRRKDLPVLAETMELMLTDQDLRRELLQRERARLEDFSEERVSHALADHLAPFLVGF